MSTARTRYSLVSLTLHWLTALLVLGQIVLITFAEEASGSERGTWMMLHKSGGVTILVLTLARLGWRAAYPAIPLPHGTPGWQRIAARATHVLFYVLLLALPLTGWLAGSAAGRGFEWYGLFDFPLLPIGGGRELAGTLMDVHEALPKLLYVLLFLHVAGALKHHFLDRDDVLRRMLPFLPRRT